jgi:hypothetical protein
MTDSPIARGSVSEDQMRASPETGSHVEGARHSRVAKLSIGIGKALSGAIVLAIIVGGAMFVGVDLVQPTSKQHASALQQPARGPAGGIAQPRVPTPSEPMTAVAVSSPTATALPADHVEPALSGPTSESSGGGAAPADAELLLNYLRGEMPEPINRARANCERGSIYAWSWSYLARAALEAYDRTRDQRFLDVFVETADVVVDDRDHLQGRIDEYRDRMLPTWGTCRHLKGKYTSVLTHAGRIALPLLTFSLIVGEDDALPEKYRKRVALYTSAARMALASFEDDYRRIPEKGFGYYDRPTRGDVEALNHTHSAGEAFVLLYALTGDASYRQRVEELGRYFVASTWEGENGCREWPYVAVPESLGSRVPEAEPMWKAQITILFPIAAYQHGLFFDRTFIGELSCLFHNNIHDGNLVFTPRISADEEEKPIDGTKRRHRLLAGWYVLDRYDPSVGDVIEAAIATRPDLFPDGWFSHPATVLAYAQRLGNAGGADRAEPSRH